jgi:hypothetical protein
LKEGRRFYSLLVAGGIAAGLYLRWRMVASGRSLWLDPAMLVWNVIQRGYGELFSRLDENQAAPYGFLCLLKAAGSLGDYSEASLLAVPFLAACAALLLFARLALDLLGREGAAFAVWPLALSSTAVYYAGEVKQYSLDLLATTLILWLAWRYAAGGRRTRDLRIFAGGTMLAGWFSHPSLLVAAAMLLVLVAATSKSGDEAARRGLAIWGGLLSAHHLLLYFFQMREAAGPDLAAHYQPHFAPWPPWQDFAWYREALLGYFEFPLGYPGAVTLPLLGAALGIVALRGRRLEAALVIGPLVLLLAASLLRFYPIQAGGHDIQPRLLLFTLPCVCLLIGRGFASLVPERRFAATLVLLAALAFPAASRSFGEPGYLRQDMAPLVDDLRAQLEPGDRVYVFHAAVPAFRYYVRKEPIPYLAGAIGASSEAELRQDAAKLPAGRVWVVLSSFWSGEDLILRGILEERGERLMKHIHGGTVLELYLLREPGPSQSE